MQVVGPFRWGGQDANFEKRWEGMQEDPVGSLGLGGGEQGRQSE